MAIVAIVALTVIGSTAVAAGHEKPEVTKSNDAMVREYDFDIYPSTLFGDPQVELRDVTRDTGAYNVYYANGSWYHNALNEGFYIGASGSQDNRSANWGTMNEWRMAVLASEKTRASIFEAMKARRFYSCRYRQEGRQSAARALAFLRVLRL